MKQKPKRGRCNGTNFPCEAPPLDMNIRMLRRGAWTTEFNHDYSSPHRCKACEAKKGRTQILLSSIYFVI